MSSADLTSTTVRDSHPGDRPLIRDVVEQAFGQPRVADLAEALQDSPSAAAGLSLVAERGDAVVGHVQLSRGWVDAATQLVEVLVLSPLAVRPSHQRQGVGALLVAAALAGAATRAAPLVFLEGEPDYYPRFGFEVATRRGFTPPSVRIPDVAFLVAVLDSWQPWMTGALVYPDVFWDLDCVGLR